MVTLLNTTGMHGDINLIYQTAPFYLNTWFYIALLCIVLGLGALAWVYFQYNIKNRTNLRVHKDDHKVKTYSFKDVESEYLKVDTGTKDSQGNPITKLYHVVTDCIEFGFFGRYLDYIGDETEPINFKNLKNRNFNFADFQKSMTSYFNSETLSMLLLIGKLKDLLVSLLTIILIVVCIGFIISIILPFVISHSSVCTLDNSNATINVIQQAIRGLK
jgi:hypothetical protein